MRNAVLAVILIAVGLGPGTAAAVDEHGTKPRILTLQILVVESRGGQPSPALKTVVRVEGSDDTFETNSTGLVKLFGLSADQGKLQIMVPGIPICRLSYTAVLARDGVATVLVEKGEAVRCTFAE
jgi:hypothetical protein